jgi:hypothetical protein
VRDVRSFPTIHPLHTLLLRLLLFPNPRNPWHVGSSPRPTLWLQINRQSVHAAPAEGLSDKRRSRPQPDNQYRHRRPSPGASASSASVCRSHGKKPASGEVTAVAALELALPHRSSLVRLHPLHLLSAPSPKIVKLVLCFVLVSGLVYFSSVAVLCHVFLFIQFSVARMSTWLVWSPCAPRRTP